jgi:hypothetical protein
VFNEANSPFYEANAAPHEAALAELGEEDAAESNMKYTVNGFIFCNTPGLNMTVGERWVHGPSAQLAHLVSGALACCWLLLLPCGYLLAITCGYFLAVVAWFLTAHSRSPPFYTQGSLVRQLLGQRRRHPHRALAWHHLQPRRPHG